MGPDANEVRPVDSRLLLKVTLEPPAMGTHFSGLSLKKWSPGRAASVKLGSDSNEFKL